METMQKYTHPLTLYHQRIKEEGIVVFDDARGLPATGKKPFVSYDYIICIANRGHIDLMYDDFLDFSEQYTVGVIFPGHSLKTVKKIDDYVATLVVVDASVLDDPMLRIINQMRYYYEPHPCVKLNKHQYRMIMNIVQLMQETKKCDLADRRMLLTRQLEFLLRLLGSYRQSNLNEINEEKRVSSLFHYHLTQHFLQHRDVGFYADLLCLSPKNFSEVVRQETGHTAAYWIRTQVIHEAKMILHTRRDLTVQAVADIMGFVDQASFSRYFRRDDKFSKLTDEQVAAIQYKINRRPRKKLGFRIPFQEFYLSLQT